MHKHFFPPSKQSLAVAAKRGRKDISSLRFDMLQEHPTEMVIKALKKIRFRRLRRRKYHIEVRREKPSTNILLPSTTHINRGDLHTIANKAGLEVQELKELLDQVYREAHYVEKLQM